MNGDAELPQRSSSPLKRRASSMDPDAGPSKNGSMDIDGSQSSQQMNMSADEFPRAMSVDAPDVNGHEASLSQRKIHLTPESFVFFFWNGLAWYIIKYARL